jgi:N-glycosidase YbiA
MLSVSLPTICTSYGTNDATRTITVFFETNREVIFTRPLINMHLLIAETTPMFISNRKFRLILNQSSMLVARRPIAFPPIPEDGTIRFYKRDRPDFGFLSNFHIAPVEIEGTIWPHSEAFYQSRKSENPEYHARILQHEKASWSKYVGDSRTGDSEIAAQSWFRTRPEDLRTDWDQIKIEVMRVALRAKFMQHEHLRLSLIATCNAVIIEDSASDYFWGSGADGSGENWLGRLLMELRELCDRKKRGC